MDGLSAMLSVTRARKRPLQQETKEQEEESRKSRRAEQEEDEDDDDDLSVHAEERYRDEAGLDPLFTMKRCRAVMTRHGFSKVQPACFQALDAHFKRCLKEIVARSIITAACKGRSMPNKRDAITSIQEMGIFPSVIIG